MKIDNLQMPKVFSKKDTLKSKESTDDFSKVLSGTIATNKESNVKENKEVDKADKVVDSNTKDTELDDTMELVNPLLMFVNIPLFEDEVIDIAALGEEELVDISSNSLTTSSLPDSDIMKMVDMSLINTKPDEEFVLNENLIVPEILVNNSTFENETRDFDSKMLQVETNLDVNSGNALINPKSKYESSDTNLLKDNEFTPINEVKEINLEEFIKTEDVDLTKLMDDEALDIKKDDSIGEAKWINHNLEGTQKVNVANEIVQEAKVISNENIQNINDSIIQLMETTTEGNTNVMKVQLYPEELGAVNITLKMENGKLIAKILVDDDYVKQLFTGKIELLSNNLSKQNVNMESIFVELNNNANSNPNGNSNQNSSNFLNQREKFEFTSESLEGTTTEEIDLNSGELSILA